MSVIPHGLPDVRGLDQLRQAQEAKPSPDGAAKTPMHHVDHVSAAEELSFGITARARSRSAERESASLGRNVDQRTLVRHAYRISRLKGVYAAFDEVAWHDELKSQAEKLLKVAREPLGGDDRLGDPPQEDPFKRYVALLEARQQVAGDDAVGQRLDRALDRAWDEHQDAIVAGFNTMTPLRRFVKNVAEWDMFRGIYLDCVAHGELPRTFKALLDRFGPARLPKAVLALRNAIAADLASPIVCADKARWEQQCLDLADNWRISSLITSTEDFCALQLQPASPTPETVMSFVGGVFDFAAGPNDRKLSALCALLEPEDSVDERLRQNVRRFLIRNVPYWWWSNRDALDFLFPSALRRK